MPIRRTRNAPRRGRANRRRFAHIRSVYAHDPEVWVRVGLAWTEAHTAAGLLGAYPLLLDARPVAPGTLHLAAVSVRSAMDKSPERRGDEMIPWLARETARALKAVRRAARKRPDEALPDGPVNALAEMLAREQVDKVIDWRLAPARDDGGAGTDMGKVTWPDAHQRAAAWHAAMLEGEGRRLGLRHQGAVVHQWPDGWTVQQLTADLLAAEGEAMQNCIEGYWDQVQAHSSVIYSLRDPAGQPHVTIEAVAEREDDGRGGYDAVPYEIASTEGRSQTSPPAERHRWRLREFFTAILDEPDTWGTAGVQAAYTRRDMWGLARSPAVSALVTEGVFHDLPWGRALSKGYDEIKRAVPWGGTLGTLNVEFDGTSATLALGASVVLITQSLITAHVVRALAGPSSGLTPAGRIFLDQSVAGWVLPVGTYAGRVYRATARPLQGPRENGGERTSYDPRNRHRTPWPTARARPGGRPLILWGARGLDPYPETRGRVAAPTPTVITPYSLAHLWEFIHADRDSQLTDRHARQMAGAQRAVRGLLEGAVARVPLRLPARPSPRGIESAFHRSTVHLRKETAKILRRLGLGGTGLPVRLPRPGTVAGDVFDDDDLFAEAWRGEPPWQTVEGFHLWQRRLGPTKITLAAVAPELADWFARHTADRLNAAGAAAAASEAG